MKWFIAVLSGVSVGCFAKGLAHWVTQVQKPSADFATVAKKVPGLSRYIVHLTPILHETPLPSPMDLSLFLALQGLCGLLVWGVALAAFTSASLWMALPLLGAGATLPYWWLQSRRNQWHIALLKALPECLELLALVMEAGLDLGAGLQHYLQKGPRGPLRDLLASVQKETQMGRSRLEALSRLAQKTSFAPLREVSRGLVQALSLGTSLAPLLREQAASLRAKRMQMAEKKAAEAPLKILFPLLVFIFPTVFIVLFGPVVILFMRGGF